MPNEPNNSVFLLPVNKHTLAVTEILKQETQSDLYYSCRYLIKIDGFVRESPLLIYMDTYLAS